MSAITELLHKKDLEAKLDVGRVVHFKPVKKGNEMLVLSLDLDLKMNKLFSWNTKQVFFSLQAEYASPRHGINQVTFLDHIVKSTEVKEFQEIDLRNEYPIVSRGRVLKGNTMNITLHWEALPKVGMIRTGNVPLVTGYKLPNSYVMED